MGEPKDESLKDEVLAKSKETDVEILLDKLEVEDDEEDEKPEIIDDDFIDDLTLKDAQVNLTDEELEDRKKEALVFKDDGNALFKQEKFSDARMKYTAALRLCPLANDKERSVLFANRGACNMKEGRRSQAIEDCTKAIDLNPTYLKALKRRAALYEEEDKLDECLEDYKKVFELDKTDWQAIDAMQTLPSRINEKNEKLKEQMLGTLKELGNKILRPFGLSTENFQMQQDPNSGGYTINFNQNKS